jgi:hypothetical protein
MDREAFGSVLHDVNVSEVRSICRVNRLSIYLMGSALSHLYCVTLLQKERAAAESGPSY